MMGTKIRQFVPLPNPSLEKPVPNENFYRQLEKLDPGYLPIAPSSAPGEFRNRCTEVPASAQVVVYCRDEFCLLARQAARWMCGTGISAMVMDQGVTGWRATRAMDPDAIA